MAQRRLTQKQVRFGEVYDGNGVQSAKEAGYEGKYSTLNQVAVANLKDPRIQKIIAERDKEVIEESIAGKAEIREFWTEIIRDVNAPYSARMDASGKLAKSFAMFIDKQETKVEEKVINVLKLPGLTRAEWEKEYLEDEE